MEEKIYKFAEEFTKYPGARYRTISDFSGEEFREDVLEDIFKKKNHKLIINIDGVIGFPVSFTDEAFVQLKKKNPDDFDKYIDIIGEKSDELKETIEEYYTDEL